MHTGSYVDGKWFHPKSNRLVRNLNPADPDEVIAEFPAATADDVNHAIDAAQAAFRSWKKTPGPERGRVLWRRDPGDSGVGGRWHQATRPVHAEPSQHARARGDGRTLPSGGCVWAVH